jgi:DNA-binding IclR family transcriptional regulator
MAGNSSETGRSVTSQVIAILLAFTTGSIHSLTELARLAGLPVSTAYRLATELAAWGVLERTDDGQYRIGEYLKILGGHVSGPPSGVNGRVCRVMEDLAAASGRTDVRFGVLTELDVAYFQKPAGSRPVSMSFEPTNLPAHATAMGKALLAFSPAGVVDKVIARGLTQYTPYTVTSPEQLRRSLAVTRLTRVAMVRRELDIRTVAVAVPVFGVGGEVVAALELQGREGQDMRLMRAPLIVAARTLSRELAIQHVSAQPPVSGGPAIWRRLNGVAH